MRINIYMNKQTNQIINEILKIRNRGFMPLLRQIWTSVAFAMDGVSDQV